MSAPTIDETAIMPEEISRGAIVRPGYQTVVVAGAAGTEQRISQRVLPRLRYEIAHESRTAAQAATIIAFFRPRKGRFRGFRFKDWSDYSATNEPLAYLGGPALQLTKTYTSGGLSEVRPIYKPMVTPATTLRRNGGAFVSFSLDTTTGLVTLTPQQGPYTITGITNAFNPVVTCSSAPGFGVPFKVWIDGVVGMTGVNGRLHEVGGAVVGNTFPILTDTTAAGTYGSGGTVAHYWLSGNPNIPDAFDATFNYHVPVRFVSDELTYIQQDVNWFDFQSMQLIELLG